MEGLGLTLKSNFWKNKKVLVTGHTGFKGSWLSLWLKLLGANVYGYSLKPNDKLNFYSAIKLKEILDYSEFKDIRDKKSLNNFIRKKKPEIIFHLAAQPLVNESYKDPLYTFETNIIGTANVIELARKNNYTKSIVVVTSDKCYANKSAKPLNENDELGGHDPYSYSKACAEFISSSFIKSYPNDKIRIATARAGNVIGGGDWAKDRIVSDLIQSIKSNKNLNLRYPQATRPWQHVFEPLSGYINLCSSLYRSKKYSDSWNFGPRLNNNINVKEFSKKFIKKYKSNIKIVGTEKKYYEKKFLMLNSSKAKKDLGWKPKWNIDKSIYETVRWYQNFYTKNTSSQKFSINQLESYIKE